MHKLRSVLLVGLMASGCLDRIDIPIPLEEGKDIIVDGSITDQPGPYTVTLTRAIKIDGPEILPQKVSARKVILSDDAGHSEELIAVNEGTYQTQSNGIQGTIGRTYTLRIEANDGRIFESSPETLYPVGSIDSLYYQFHTFFPEDGPQEYGYRIFINAHDIPGGNHYLRWRFIGTYIVHTEPQYHLPEKPQGVPCGPQSVFDPLPCSGYAYVDGVLHEGYALNPTTHQIEFVQGLTCTCCKCWVTQPEDQPHVSDVQVSSDGKFSKVEVAYVPVNYYTFQERYRVEIQQMSLSRAAFQYWKDVQSQKESVGSLFQPLIGKITTNMHEVNGQGGVAGLFYASAITRKQMYLSKDTERVDIREPVDCTGRAGPAGASCLVKFKFATTTQPEDWLD